MGVVTLLLVSSIELRRYHLNLVLSWNILFSQSVMTKSFAGYRCLSWRLCSLRVCMSYVYNLLAFRVCWEVWCNSDMSLWVFPSLLLIVFLCFVHLVFWLFYDGRIFFSGPNYLVFCKLPECLWPSISSC